LVACVTALAALALRSEERRGGSALEALAGDP